MSKKTSPQSRPSRRPRGRTSGPQPVRSTAGRSAGTQRTDRGRRAAARTRKKDAKQQAPVPTTFGGRIRRYLPVVLIPNIVVVLGLVVLGLAGLMLSSTTLTALPATLAQSWLVLNLVPAVAGGVEIGVLPMLPALGLAALIARRVHGAVKDRVSIADLVVLAACTLLVPVILTLVASVMMWDAGRVFEVSPPPLGDAILRTLAVHLVGLVVGMGARLWRALLRHYGLPDWLVDAAGSAWRFLVWLAGAALVVLVVLLAFGWQRQVDLLSHFDGAGGVAALVLISLLYLPNALVATSGVLMGSEFNLGEASVSLFSIHLVPLPTLPLMAVIPGTASEWAVVLLAIPAVIAAVLAYRARPSAPQAVAGGLLAAVVMLVLCYLTRGAIGYYGPSGPMPWLTPALAFVWVAGVGLAVAGAGRLAELRNRELEPEPEAETETEPEDEEALDDSEDVEDVESVESVEDSDEVEEAAAAAAPDAEGAADDDEPEESTELAEVTDADADTDTEVADGAETADTQEAETAASPTADGEDPGEAGDPEPKG